VRRALAKVTFTLDFLALKGLNIVCEIVKLWNTVKYKFDVKMSKFEQVNFFSFYKNYEILSNGSK